MKFSIERADLVKAVSQAQYVVERRNTIPILANVLIEATPEGVSLRATDLDTEIVDRANAQVERPGATTAKATKRATRDSLSSCGRKKAPSRTPSMPHNWWFR